VPATVVDFEIFDLITLSNGHAVQPCRLPVRLLHPQTIRRPTSCRYFFFLRISSRRFLSISWASCWNTVLILP